MSIFGGDHKVRDSSHAVGRWRAERNPVAFRGIDGRELARQYLLNLELSSLAEGGRLEGRARRKLRIPGTDGITGAHGPGTQRRSPGKRPLSGRIAELLNLFRALVR